MLQITLGMQVHVHVQYYIRSFFSLAKLKISKFGHVTEFLTGYNKSDHENEFIYDQS